MPSAAQAAPCRTLKAVALLALLGVLMHGALSEDYTAPVPLSQLTYTVSTSICASEENQCLDALSWHIKFPSSNVTTCIGPPSLSCKYADPAAYLTENADTTSFWPVELNITLPSLDNAFQMGHTQTAGLVMNKLERVSVTCSDPVTVFAPAAMVPLLEAVTAANTTEPSALPPNLKQLSITGCLLTGTLPRALAAFSTLSSLDLSDNLLSGTVPAFDIPSSLVHLNLSRNLWYGGIPSQLSTLGGCGSNLDLSHNHLHGDIPSSWISSTCSMYAKTASGIAVEPSSDGECSITGIRWDVKHSSKVLVEVPSSNSSMLRTIPFPFTVFLEGNHRLSYPGGDYAAAFHKRLTHSMFLNHCTRLDPMPLVYGWASFVGLCVVTTLVAYAVHYYMRSNKKVTHLAGERYFAAPADTTPKGRVRRWSVLATQRMVQGRDMLVSTAKRAGTNIHTRVVKPASRLPWMLVSASIALICLAGTTVAVTLLFASKTRRDYCGTLVDCIPLLYLVPAGIFTTSWGAVLYLISSVISLAGQAVPVLQPGAKEVPQHPPNRTASSVAQEAAEQLAELQDKLQQQVQLAVGSQPAPVNLPAPPKVRTAPGPSRFQANTAPVVAPNGQLPVHHLVRSNPDSPAGPVGEGLLPLGDTYFTEADLTSYSYCITHPLQPRPIAEATEPPAILPEAPDSPSVSIELGPGDEDEDAAVVQARAVAEGTEQYSYNTASNQPPLPSIGFHAISMGGAPQLSKLRTQPASTPQPPSHFWNYRSNTPRGPDETSAGRVLEDAVATPVAIPPQGAATAFHRPHMQVIAPPSTPAPPRLDGTAQETAEGAHVDVDEVMRRVRAVHFAWWFGEKSSGILGSCWQFVKALVTVVVFPIAIYTFATTLQDKAKHWRPTGFGHKQLSRMGTLWCMLVVTGLHLCATWAALPMAIFTSAVYGLGVIWGKSSVPQAEVTLVCLVFCWMCFFVAVCDMVQKRAALKKRICQFLLAWSPY